MKVEMNNKKTTVSIENKMTKEEIIAFISFDNKSIGRIEAMNFPELFYQSENNSRSYKTVLEIHNQTAELDMIKKIANSDTRQMENTECLVVACTILQYHLENPNDDLLTNNGINYLLSTRIDGFLNRYDFLYIKLEKEEDNRWSFGCERNYGSTEKQRLNEPFWFPVGSKLFFAIH